MVFSVNDDMKKRTKMEEKIISLVARRDDCDREEVEYALDEFRAWFDNLQDFDLVEIEERFMDEFGLEPDYLHGFII